MDSSDSEENEHFLQHHDDEQSSCKHRPRRTLLLHIIFFILYVCFTAIVLFAYQSHSSDGGTRLNTLSERSSSSTFSIFPNRAF